MTELSPAEEAFYDALDKAREALDEPTFQEISNMTAGLRPVAVPAPTIRGWFKRENLPRNNPTGEDQLLAVAAALRADAGEIDWPELAHQARKGRDARLKGKRLETEEPPEEPEPQRESGPEVPPDSGPTDESHPSPARALGRSWTRLSIVVPAAFCLIVVVGIGVFLLTSPPQASCAKVVVEPGASAAVWKELGEAPLRYKRHDDQVKLYEAKDLVTVDGIVYQPVHVREGGWALMRRDELEDVKCSVQ